MGRWRVSLSCAFAAASAACSNPDATPAAPTDGGVESAADASVSDTSQPEASADSSLDGGLAGVFCTAETPMVVASGSGFSATTTHYDLYAETTQNEAAELARLLEASSAGFASWFERPAPAQRMKVRYYKDQPSWVAGLAADGIMAPAEAGGYYAPSTKTAYLYRQGNPYYSHVLLVHEATHQYHFLTRLQGQALPFWYVEGHAEYLSRHDWDGQCVRLGVMSLLSWEDLPASAAAESSPDYAGILAGTAMATRGDAWAIFRYLDTGSLKSQFKTYRDAFDANTSPSFASVVAPPASLAAPIAAWLPTAQEPMKPIFTEWIHVGPHAVDVDTPIYFSHALVKAKVSHLEATFVPASSTWTVGVIVSWTDDKHYLGVVQSNDGSVKTFTANGPAYWTTIGSAPVGSPEVFAVDYTSNNALVTFNGKAISVPLTGLVRAGLAASDTTGQLVNVTWQ